jgi:hypothetical protein
VPSDREAEDGDEHDRGHAIDGERAGCGRQNERRDTSRELLAESDRVSSTLGVRLMAQASADQEHDDHDRGDQPGGLRRDAHRPGTDEREKQPHRDGTESRRADPTGALGPVSMLVQTLELGIDESERPSVVLVPTGRQGHAVSLGCRQGHGRKPV